MGADHQDARPREVHGGELKKKKKKVERRERKRLSTFDFFFSLFLGTNLFFFSTSTPLFSPSLSRSLSLSLSLSLSRTQKQRQYGAAVLAIELLGATTVLLYGVNLLLLPAAPSPDADAVVDEATGLPRASCPYHVRVLVPCYKESLDILRRTVVAARDAPLPLGCAGKTVYLCDDGRDPKKRKWVDALGDPGVVYVSGRQRPAGEMNGAISFIFFAFLEQGGRREGEGEGERRRKKDDKKQKTEQKKKIFLPLSTLDLQPYCFPSHLSLSSSSFSLFLFSGKSGNINNVARQLYGHTRGRVPGNELICIFDADQVRERERESFYFFGREKREREREKSRRASTSTRRRRRRRRRPDKKTQTLSGRIQGVLPQDGPALRRRRRRRDGPVAAVLPQPEPARRHLQPLQRPLLGVRFLFFFFFFFFFFLFLCFF